MLEKRNRPESVLIAARVSPQEQRLIRAAGSLDGETVSDFLRRLAIPEAIRRLELAATKGFSGGGRRVTTAA